MQGIASMSEGEEALSNSDIPAAFWDTLAEDESNPDLLAIKALQEESTPDERAETLKVESPLQSYLHHVWFQVFFGAISRKV